MKRIKHLLYVVIILLVFFTACKDVQKEYYPDGKLKVEAQYKDGLIDGYYKSYHSNSNLEIEAYYKKGKQEGVTKAYYSNGQLEWEVPYKEGKEFGLYKKCSEKGILLSEGNYKNGKQEGLTKYYYGNGKLESEQDYKDGILHGKAVFYYPSEKVKMDAIIDNDESVYYKKFDEQGKVIKEHRYILIEFENDSIYLGDSCKANIKVYGPLPEKSYIEVVLADMETDFNTPFEKVSLNENGETIYTSKPDMTERHMLNVRIKVDTTMFSNTADLYVLEKPES